MKQLAGFVLAKEQNVGVPRLIVEVYDIRDATSVRFDRKEPLGKIGRRLGSVLTDADGHFAFSTDDLEFQGNEARPNIVIAVLAPEDACSVDDPVPLPPQQRLLFLSAAPRLDAGADEAFVIRLLAAQLQRFGIATEAANGSTQRNARVADSVERSWATSAYLAQRFQPKMKERLKNAAEGRARAKKAVANLSAIPRHLRDSSKGTPNKLQNNSLLISDRRQLADKLPQLQESAIAVGIKRLDQSKSPPVMRLRLNKEQVRKLGLKIDKEGVVSGTVDGQALREIARKSIRGSDLVRTRGMDNPSVDELRRRYLTPIAADKALKSGKPAKRATKTPDAQKPTPSQPGSKARPARRGTKPRRTKA